MKEQASSRKPKIARSYGRTIMYICSSTAVFYMLSKAPQDGMGPRWARRANALGGVVDDAV